MIFPSTLIICRTQTSISQRLSEIATEISNSISPNNPDLFVINDTTGWGIEVVRSIKQFLSQKPIKYPTKLVIIYDAHNLGTEAQNALLKSLEEPPQDSHIVLVSPNRQSILTTIISRCRLIKINSTNKPEDVELIKPSPEIKENLILSENICKDKEKVLPYLENQLSLYHQKLITNPNLSKTIQKLIRTIQMIKSNVDPKSAVDWFLLS